MSGTSGLRVLSPRGLWMSWAVLAGLLFLMLYPSPVFPWAPAPDSAPTFVESDYRQVGAFLQANTAADAVVVSDAYWLVSWYGNRTSLWFPVDLATLDEIERSYVNVDAVLLTPTYVSEAALTDPIWQNLFDRPVPFGEFQIVKEFQSTHGLRAVLFLKQQVPS